MAGYFIASYDVTDPEAYAKYNPGSMGLIMQTLQKHGGKPLVAGGENQWDAGERKSLVVIEFPTTEAAQAWLSDPDYAPAKAIRLAATGNRFEVVAPSFVPPAG